MSFWRGAVLCLALSRMTWEGWGRVRLALRDAHLLRIISYRVGNTYGIIQTGNSRTSFVFRAKKCRLRENILPKATKQNMGA